MKRNSLFGLILLSILWIWLAWAVLFRGGMTLYNILIVAISGMIVFIPLVRKFTSNRLDDNHSDLSSEKNTKGKRKNG